MIKKQFEFNRNQESNSLFEMARINSENDSITYDICIYGSSDFHHNGRQEHNPPHFHIFDDCSNPTYEILVIIPSTKEWIVDKHITIYKIEPWSKIKKENKIIRRVEKWLDEDNSKNIKITNIEAVRLAWNFNNADNSKVSQIL
jgi:hypothetical protein